MTSYTRIQIHIYGNLGKYYKKFLFYTGIQQKNPDSAFEAKSGCHDIGSTFKTSNSVCAETVFFKIQRSHTCRFLKNRIEINLRCVAAGNGNTFNRLVCSQQQFLCCCQTNRLQITAGCFVVISFEQTMEVGGTEVCNDCHIGELQRLLIILFDVMPGFFQMTAVIRRSHSIILPGVGVHHIQKLIHLAVNIQIFSFKIAVNGISQCLQQIAVFCLTGDYKGCRQPIQKRADWGRRRH